MNTERLRKTYIKYEKLLYLIKVTNDSINTGKKQANKEMGC